MDLYTVHCTVYSVQIVYYVGTACLHKQYNLDGLSQVKTKDLSASVLIDVNVQNISIM